MSSTGIHGGATAAASAGLTNTELRASPVPVSGTVTASPSSDTVSTLNSSTTPLAGNASFTGTYEDVTAYASLSVFSTSDVGGTAPTLELQWSDDAVSTNISQPMDGSTLASRVLTAPIVAKYVRVKYNNGVTIQTRFNLQTVFHRTASASLGLYNLGTPANTILGSKFNVPINAAVIHGIYPDGTIQPIAIDASGNLKTAQQTAVTVAATDLDVRNLVFATDKVDVSGSTGVGVTGTFWQTTQPTKEVRSATPTTTTVADNASNVTLLAANANRLGATIANDSTAALYIKLGATASLTSYTVRLMQHGYYETPYGYTGVIEGIWATDPNDGAARVTELVA